MILQLIKKENSEMKLVALEKDMLRMVILAQDKLAELQPLNQTMLLDQSVKERLKL